MNEPLENPPSQDQETDARKKRPRSPVRPKKVPAEKPEPVQNFVRPSAKHPPKTKPKTSTANAPKKKTKQKKNDTIIN